MASHPRNQALKSHTLKKALSLVLVLVVCCCSLAGSLQTGPQQFAATVQRYDPEQGLAHREVNAIFQDRRDFMWFGTKLGLCRFDGAIFTTYTREKNGLDFDDIQSIAQDADGLLWLMGPVGKSAITLFDPLTGQVTSFLKRFHQSRPTHPPEVKQFLLGSPDGSILFVDYQPAKLYVYHPKTGLRTVALPQYKTLIMAAVTTRNTVWVFADATRLVELTMDGRVLQTYEHPKKLYACLGQSNASTELVYRYTKTNDPWGPIDKLYKIDGAGHRQALSPALVESKKLRNPLAYALNQRGLLWNGCQLREATGRVVLDITSQLASGLIDSKSFLCDRNGGMWLGTSFGIYQTRVGKNYFRRLFYQSDDGKLPAVRGITAVGDTLYTNLENMGLFSSTKSGESARRLLAKLDVFNSLSDPLGGKLYLGQGNTLVGYEYQTTKITVMPTLSPGVIWSIHSFSTNPHRLLAGGDPGLWLVDPAANRVIPFRGYNQFPELAQAHVLHIGTDRQGTIWLCATTGLYTIDPQRGVTARYWRGGRGSFKLPADSYQHFYQAPSGLFWLATANAGLVRWDRSQDRSRSFKRADGLNNDNIYAVYADRRGHLWLSSDYGIMQFDPVRLTTRSYTVQDGLTNNEFNRIAHYQDAQGRLYFGGLNGVTAFDPQDFDAEPPLPALPLRVVSFRQFDANHNTLVDKTGELLRTNQITLPPNDRSSMLEVALLNYTDAQKNTYAYQFRGVDNTWRYQTESSLRLGNLPYGDHTLLIRGQAADGRMSSSTLSIRVHVLRPFYLRDWFAFPLVFLLLGGMWAWGRWRAWQYRKAQIRLQTQINEATQTIARQAQDLLRLDKTKSRFFANISHEFRTPLTVILGMADNLHRQADPRLQNSAVLIERNGRNLLRLINQILDLSRLEAGAMYLQPVRVDLVGFTRYITESFHTMAAIKDIQLHFQADQERVDTDFDKDKLGDILSNLLTNAIKFTPDGGRVSFQLTTHTKWLPMENDYVEAVSPTQHRDDPWISMHVYNTGRGIAPHDLPKIFDRFYQRSASADSKPVSEAGGTGIGLSLVRELVVLMNGGLAVRSQWGEGAEFVIRLRQTQLAPMAVTSDNEPVSPYPDMLEEVEPADDADVEKPVLLLAEDNEDVARYIISCLQADYRILHAKNGQIGIDQALAVIPDLIVSDVMMPLKDGFDLCDTLKNDERTSHIPIVLLTARAAIADRLTGLRRGGDAYLVKPFQREELLLVLSNLLQTRRLLQRYYSQRALGNPQPEPVPADGADAKEDQFVTKLRSTLELHLDNVALDTDMICQLMGMSRKTLYRKMMALTGLSVVPYLRTLRLQKAEELLLHSTFSVADVAYAVGFDNPRYFSRVFSEEKGVSPSSFRNIE